MSQPTPYVRQYNFIDYQTVNPTLPLPADQIEAEFNAIKLTDDQILQNLAAIQRDDGKLGNLTVHPESLDAAVLSLMGGFVFRGGWLTATVYAVKDIVTQTNNSYLCIVAHTSGVFATDLAANKWILLTKTGIAPDGSVLPTANLPMGGFKFTGLGVGSARTDSVTLGQEQDSFGKWAAVSGTANAIVLTLTPAITAYVAGQTIRFKATGNNSGATTVNYGAGALAVQLNGAACVGGEIKTGRTYQLTHDGTVLQLANVPEATQTLAGVAEIATQAEVNAGTDDARFVTPLKLATRAAAETLAGLAEIATQTEVDAGADDARIVTALKLWATPMRGGWRNFIQRNPGAEVFSRGASVAVAAPLTAYVDDCWYLTTNANQASVVSQQGNLGGASRFAARNQRNAGQTGTGFMIRGFPFDLDEVFAMRGRETALRFDVRAGANWSPASGTLNYLLALGTVASPAKRNGTPYTGEVQYLTGSVNLTPGGGVVTVTSALSATISTAMGQGELSFFWQPVGTAGADDWFEIDNVVVEESPAPNYEFRPRDIEVMQARRHVFVLGGDATNQPIGAGYARSTTVARIYVPFKTRMRALITGITVSNAANFRVQRAATTVALTTLTFSSADADGAFLDATVAAGLTVGEGILLETNNTNCQIIFTGAEI